jgi:hypothetical protein
MAWDLRKLAEDRPWAAELSLAGIGLLLGVTLMPVLIFYAGVATLGRFDGASLGQLYSSLFQEASIASWVVFLGPYGLYLLFRALRAWWRASARLNESA